MADWPYNTSTWQKLRRLKLTRDPLCSACRLRGRMVRADTVDHVRAIADGGHPFPSLDELMSLCASCHSIKTAAVDRPDWQAAGRRFKGFDTHGNPIDPTDAWYRGAFKDGKSQAERPRPPCQKYILRRRT